MSEPWNPDTVVDLEIHHVFNQIDQANDLVTRDDRIFDAGKSASTTWRSVRQTPHTLTFTGHLSDARGPILAFLHPKRRARSREHHRSHSLFSNGNDEAKPSVEPAGSECTLSRHHILKLKPGRRLTLIKSFFGDVRSNYERAKRRRSQLEDTINMKSLIPVGRERSVVRHESKPFMTLQQEIDRLFDSFTRSFSGLASNTLMPSMDLSETDKEIEITAELPSLEDKGHSVERRGQPFDDPQ